MKISLQKKLNKDKTKAYLILCKYKGNKIVNGKTKADRVRESLGLFLWVNPKGIKQKQHNKEVELKADFRLKKIQTEFESGLYNVYNPENRKINFTDYWLEWADDHCTGDQTDTTKNRSNFSQFKTSLKHFKAFTGDQLTIGDIDYNLCDGFAKYLSKQAVKYSDGSKLATSTINTFYKKFDLVVWSLFNKELLIGTHPAPRKLITLPKIIEKKPEYLSIDELKRLDYNECDNPQYAKAFMFACYTGLRSSDITTLKWGDVRFKEDGSQYLYFAMEKGDKPIVVPLSQQALKYMGERTEDSDRAFPYFTYHGNNNNRLYYWLKLSGINKKITFHDSRSSFITNTILLTNGNVEVAQRLSGHKDIRTTAGYNKLTDEGKDEAISLFDKALQ
jgi:integrase